MKFEYRYFGLFRLILAAMVMVQHFVANAAPMGLTLALQPYEPGSVAVLAFFCLSGFVITEAADTVYRNKPGSFLVNRMLRLLPHFAAALTLSILLHGYFVSVGTLRVQRFAELPPATIFAPRNIVLNFLSILPCSGGLIGYKFIPIAWAIRVEAIFYLVIFACLAIPRLASTKADGFGAAAVGAALLFLPPFALAVLHWLPPLLGFVPYFTYGAGLYFSLRRCRPGLVITLASVPAMVWHFLSLPARHPELGFERAVGGQSLLLVLLLAAMTILARCRFRRFRRADGVIGGLTYPLYVYHYPALVFVTSAFSDYSYGTLVGGMAVAVAFSVIMARMIDPAIDRWRDRVRGERLRG